MVGRTRFLVGVATCGGGCWRCSGADQPVEVVAFGFVELQRVRHPIEDAVRDGADTTPLELGVVLHADAGKDGDLFTAETPTRRLAP